MHEIVPGVLAKLDLLLLHLEGQFAVRRLLVLLVRTLLHQLLVDEPDSLVV
jgi:hypothetical protein